MDSILSKVEKETKTEFEKNQHILSFSEYLELIEKNPEIHLRGSAQFLVDAMDFFGKDGERFKLFDMDFDDPKYRVVGQEDVQAAFYQTLQGFIREGINNKLVLLHGPNGSAKSSLINCLIRSMEAYSRQPSGALYRFNWIFPVESIVKGSLGLGSNLSKSKEMESFAKLSEDEIAAKVPCELKDHPLLVIPTTARNEFMEGAFKAKKSKNKVFLPEYLTRGSLSHKSNQIFQSLLTAYKGDLRKVLRHVQVERFYISKRYRTGAVTIEPQMHVDASARQVTMDYSLSALPISLKSLSLYELQGDLIDGNRGLIEFADILKRPIDTYKYLLIACETGSVNVGPNIANFDTILSASTNELQLDAFKEFPDFVSFKARIELIRVPYLLRYTEEKKIYDQIIHKIAGNKFITPHTMLVAALWAVLTRLKKPDPSHYPAVLNSVISDLKPIEKAKLYDQELTPTHVSSEEKKHLRASLQLMREEYSNVINYEGRLGASAREIKAILYEAAAQSHSKTLGPQNVFLELESFIKRVSEYEFLKQDAKNGYHHAGEMIETVKEEYVGIIDREVRESMGLIQASQFEDYLKRYVLQISHQLKKEKLKNPITGRMENPDLAMIEEFEKIVGAPTIPADRENFRNNVLSSIGAYSLENRNQALNYAKVFPEFIKALDNFYFEQQRAQMKKIGDAIALFGTEKESTDSDGYKLAKITIKNMIERFGYSEDCAATTILFLIKSKY